MDYKLIIFDMDGTILDTLEDLTDSVNFALRESNMPERTILEVRRFVGNGIRKLVERAVPEGTPAGNVDQVFESFSAHYEKNCANKTHPYDGITDVISELRNRGYLTAVVSNKVDVAVQELCEQYFDGLFDMAVGERVGVRRKPAPDAVNVMLEHFGLGKEDALYIGDSEVDIQTAVNAGLDHVSVGWGFKDEDFLLSNGATTILKRTEEILQILS